MTLFVVDINELAFLPHNVTVLAGDTIDLSKIVSVSLKQKAPASGDGPTSNFVNEILMTLPAGALII